MCACAGPAAAQSTKLAPDLRAVVAKGGLGSISVIVETASAPLPTDLTLASLLGGLVGQVFTTIPAFSVRLPILAVNTLAGSPSVNHISLDHALRGFWDYDVQTVGADTAGATYGVNGGGIGVAVLDSGVQPCADLGARVIGFYDCVHGFTSPYDDFGHGTHVAGIVGGSGASSSPALGCTHTFRGAAPGVNLVSVKVLDNTGSSTASRVIQGIEWCISHRAQYNLRVLNLSLGHPVAESYHTDPLNLACQAAVKAGLVVVCAAGNKGKDSLGRLTYGGITCPGNDPSIITVGASNTFGTPVRSDDGVATYSSRGPTEFDQLAKPDLVAPGNKIVSLRVPGSQLDSNFPGTEVPPASYERRA